MARPHTLAWQILFVICLTGLGKLGSFGKDIFLSFQFGVGPETDAYFIANAIPGFVFAGVFATIGLVFLPIYQRALTQGEESAASAVRTAVWTYGGLSLLISIVTIVVAPVLVETIAPDSSDSVKKLAVTLTRILACGFVFSGWVGLQSALLQAHKRFIWPQIVPVANHFVVILGLSIAFLTEGSIALLAFSAIAGWVFLAVISAFITHRPTSAVRGIAFSRSVFWKLALLSLPVFLSQSLEQLNYLIDIYLGSGFGTGAVSHLTYASRLMMLFSAAFGVIISYFIFPYLSESIQSQDYVTAQRHISRGVLMVIMLTLPLSIICLTRAPELISLAFERGAFSEADVLASSTVLLFFAPAILLTGLREVLNRVFLSTQQTRHILVFSLLGALTNIVASIYLSRTMGLSGVALGTTIGAAAYILAQVVAMIFTRFKLLPQHHWPKFIAMLLAALCMYIWFIQEIDHAFFMSPLGSIAELVIGVIIYAALLLSSLVLLRKYAKI